MITAKTARAALLTLAIGTFFTTGLTAGVKDSAKRGLYSFQVESTTGKMRTYHHRGKAYVAGKNGSQYSIRVFNRSNKRVEAVVTVDGRDVITGKIGNYKKSRGYVIMPHDSVLIEGFRTSWEDVAGFYFTSVKGSYSSRMGSGQHVGVIGVAIFEEQVKAKKRIAHPRKKYRARSSSGASMGESVDSSEGAQRSKEAKSAPSSADYDDYTEREEEAEQSIGTGFGDSEYSPATKTVFKRRSNNPGARLAIYYNSRKNLIKQGVIPKPRPRPVHTPNPFPANNDPEFAPPPPPVVHRCE